MNIKKEANKREKDLAKQFKGFRQPNSGSLITFKGDIKTEQFLFDSKHTKNKSHSITLEMLEKITKEARAQRKDPGLIISFEKVPYSISDQWVQIPAQVFLDLVHNQKD